MSIQDCIQSYVHRDALLSYYTQCLDEVHESLIEQKNSVKISSNWKQLVRT